MREIIETVNVCALSIMTAQIRNRCRRFCSELLVLNKINLAVFLRSSTSYNASIMTRIRRGVPCGVYVTWWGVALGSLDMVVESGEGDWTNRCWAMLCSRFCHARISLPLNDATRLIVTPICCCQQTPVMPKGVTLAEKVQPQRKKVRRTKEETNALRRAHYVQ